MPTIRLESSDGDILKVDRKIANLSLTIREQLEDFEMDGVPEEERLVKISHVCSRVLRIVLRWFNYHKDDPIPDVIEDTPETRRKTFDEWDTEFVNVDNGLLFELILAANFLEIRQLLHLTCQTVANKIHGKSPEEIRKAFYPDEEEEKSKTENEAKNKEQPSTSA